MKKVITADSIRKRLDGNRKENEKKQPARVSKTLEAARKLKGSIKVNDMTLFFR